MKYFIITTVLILFSFQLFGQNKDQVSQKRDGKYFRFKHSKESFIITPLFDTLIPYTKKTVVHFDSEYVKSWYRCVITECFDKSKLKKIYNFRKSKILAYFDQNGNFVYGKFFFHKEMMNILTEEELRTIYEKLKQSQLDMSKGRVDRRYTRDDGTFDYFLYTIPVMVKEP